MAAPWAHGFQARIIGTVQGQDYNNVLHFATNTQVNDAPSLAPFMLALANAILQCVAEHLLDATTSDFNFDGVEVRQVHPTPSDPVFAQSLAGSQQGQGGPTSTSFIAARANIRTGTGGKSGRGRIFFPPPDEANCTNGNIDAAKIPDFQSMLDCIVGKFIGSGATTEHRLGVLSRKKTGTPPTLPPFDERFREAISLDIASDLSPMRSRRKGHGR